MALQDILTKILGAKDAMTKLSDQVDAKTKERANIVKEQQELEKERVRLWVAQDVDGADVSRELTANEKKRAQLAEKLERVDLVLGEMVERRRHAQEEIDRQQFLAALEEMADINQDVGQLDAEYTTALATFLEAAARSAKSNQRKRILAAIIVRYTGTHDVLDTTVVAPQFCVAPEVQWPQADVFSPTARDVRMSVKFEWDSPFRQRWISPADAALLQQAREHYEHFSA